MKRWSKVDWKNKEIKTYERAVDGSGLRQENKIGCGKGVRFLATLPRLRESDELTLRREDQRSR